MSELLNREDWVKKYWLDAVAATAGTGIFPETMLAMAVVESQGKASDGNWYPGQGLVARTANNYFGIKTSSQWKGQTISLPTPGDADKISVFRVYPNLKESIKDFVRFLQTNPRYTTAGVFQATDYVSQIMAIARAGYSESSTYASVVTSIANKVKTYVKDIIVPIAQNGKYIPLLVAALIITGLLISKKLQQ
jgi:flagellum-specific peptidoglycan hydrolase FlgJ